MKATLFPMPVFPLTRHSVIERLCTPGGAGRSEAFGDLVAGYWKPVYKYLRVRWRLGPEEAEDATQALFAEAFANAWFEPDKARFRTFVRLCADRLVMNSQQAASRIRRGGGQQILSIDSAGAEDELLAQAPGAPPEAEDFFKREFVRALFDRAVRSLRKDCLTRGREVHWQLFERYDLRADERPSYAALAAEFELTPGQVTGYLAQARRAFRTHTIAELKTLCGDAEEFRREARDLLGLEIE
jgi:DNA-directed RNA polymerase specialized sigma24 family protein